MWGFFSRRSNKEASGNPEKLPSELRRDVVTGDWVVIARARSKRPSDFVTEKAPRKEKKDPFANPQASGNAPSLLRYEDERGEWTVQVIPNKYPAFTQHGECRIPREEGPFSLIDGRGYHEVLITRDDKRDFSRMEAHEAAAAVRALHARFNELAQDGCVRYISLFQNHGAEAGASVAHPHCQIMALPVVPTEVRRDVGGSRRYWERTGRRVHEDIIAWEREQGTRILFENEHFLALCPFVPRTAFEIRIFPKEQQASFAQLKQEQYEALGDALRASLAMLDGVLQDPAYNFFIHSAPLNDGREYDYYRWHVEIMPKTAIWAGFELGTGIEICSIEPERAAEFLRAQLPTWAS